MCINDLMENHIGDEFIFSKECKSQQVFFH